MSENQKLQQDLEEALTVQKLELQRQEMKELVKQQHLKLDGARAALLELEQLLVLSYLWNILMHFGVS